MHIGEIIIERFFEGKRILGQTSARLVPPDNTCPDCACDVIMTDDFIFVLEDNFDGTQDCHFKIPLERVSSVTRYKTENDGASKESGGYEPSNWTVAVMALVGVIHIPGGKRKIKSDVFLRIDYKDERYESCAIFFEECKDIKKMVSAFEEYSKLT